ncbi:CLUMA_CG019007, isoform A, partial [Clunio marinus]
MKLSTRSDSGGSALNGVWDLGTKSGLRVG